MYLPETFTALNPEPICVLKRGLAWAVDVENLPAGHPLRAVPEEELYVGAFLILTPPTQGSGTRAGCRRLRKNSTPDRFWR